MPIIAGPDKAKPKGVASVIVESMIGANKPEERDDGAFLGGQLKAAIAANDDAAIYKAFKALFQHCEMEPHAEYGEENEAE